MATNKPLILSATLENIEVEGDIEKGIRSQYFVRLYVAGKEVGKSTSSELAQSVLKWEWNEDNQIPFEPSSMMKIVVYRGFRTTTDLLNNIVAQHEGKVVDLLGNNARLNLTDKKGNSVPVKMRIVLSPTRKSEDYIKKFMERVDADVARLPSNEAVKSTFSTLGQVLKLTRTIMDQLSKAHPILNASWTAISSIYQAIEETDLQDESVRELANTLREMLGTANAIPNLPVIPDTIDVIEEISRQSLEVASLIHEYTKLSFGRRTVKIQLSGDLKSRIAGCQQRCTSLKGSLGERVLFDAHAQVKQLGRTLEVIKDVQLAEKINKWLSPPDSSRNRNEADEKRQEDTCSWFLDSERFLEWQANPSFLWIKGKAGSGKSILCSSILNKLSENHPDPTFGIAYFFFDGRDSQNALQLHNNLIRSLISQFSHQRGSIPAELADLYEHCGDNQQPSVNQLQNTLQDILDGFLHAYVVIDALDECTDREKTLIWVNKLVSDTSQIAESLHLIVTSRPERDIEKVFGMCDPHSIDVGEATSNHDISNYLEFQMKSKFKQYGEIIRQKIESELRERAEGSFRWVALQLAELDRCSSEYQIVQQLKNLPAGLEDVYKRILKAIDRKYRADTLTFLQWLAFSRRQMAIAEVAEAITVDFELEGGPTFTLAKRYADPRDVLVRCSSLVSESEGTIKLSHFSVKEYLLSDRIEKDFSISERSAHVNISEISVAYLLQFDSFEALTKATLDSSPLAQYAAEYWTDHAKSGKIPMGFD